ncbi:ATP-grasp domain-containing protein [Halobacillus sp. Cin3]|uniref:ATP-grasp domain-containing protein n=1 Tax=Halobacillus sp. Cin3 TaxID=2928441 RepID=UPI00248E9314|nr:ATP-grasp domain-containing protein [Halobacillus sp. Cin3]
MDCIVFLETHKSGSSRDAIEAAVQMGYFTILLTQQMKKMNQREEYPDVHQMIFAKDLQDKDVIYEQLAIINKQEKQIKAFISFVDPFVRLAAEMAAELGLISLSVPALYHMEDKTRFREILNGHPAAPKHAVLSLEKDADTLFHTYAEQLPFILKSPVSNGSKDVLLIKDKEAFLDACTYFKRQSGLSSLLLEEYVEGPQYLIEIIVEHGTVQLAAVIEQIISKEARFIITGYLMPAPLSDSSTEELQTTIENIVHHLGLTHGTCHAEMRKTDSGWKLIEINPRISGSAVNQLIYESTGISLVKETLKLNLGDRIDCIPKKQLSAYAHFITIQGRGKLIKVTGKQKAKTVASIKKVYVKPRRGAILSAPVSMGHRYAYVIASSPDKDEAVNAAKSAAEKIKFHLEPI